MTSSASNSNLLSTSDGLAERKYSPKELAQKVGFSEETIRKWFLDEPGVLRFGHPTTRHKRQHYILRIPESVANRFFRRMTVRGERA